MAGAVIEATARLDFEDFLRTRSPGEVILADSASALALRSRWLAFLANVTSRRGVGSIPRVDHKAP